MDRQKHRILMVSDFFFPKFGGVESHIYYLSQCLLKLGHKVVVMTHAYGNRSGVRYVTNDLKVYYVPWRPFLMQNTLPTLFLTFPVVRTIIIRERISVVHGHQAFSTLCHEALMHARTMGYKVVFTDHSLYGFADAGSIHMNKVLQFTLADIDQAICVSHTSKENTVLRSGISPEKVFMVPNAVDTAMFTPSPERLSCDEIVIVVISRLVYRKGAGLLVEVIPEVCRLFPKDRVEMLGAVPHAQVRSVLISGHIFLNSSLTEAFCIAVLEAASCGLLTVSTVDEDITTLYMHELASSTSYKSSPIWTASSVRIQPIALHRNSDISLIRRPNERTYITEKFDDMMKTINTLVTRIEHVEQRLSPIEEDEDGDVDADVLPDDMIVLAEPAPEDMVRAVKKAIDMLPGINPQVMHLQMKKLYSWDDVAKRTEIVYDRAVQSLTTNLLDRLPQLGVTEALYDSVDESL
ncbi:phosphatidylinositol N-acetylglucosaminyltransferase gpi3 subunit isoform X1 [Panicum miliaceum]|uniref:Phosphatidylinositol N-acetylglucosaminyltransferase gpi3 subunit isoform X1 n=1 Tax=Panicum miliaceum TaxID=4540 RepID=A0A3L6QRF3_PANMI|nr:phosphatidylinositol N-acetylglucosaminyltransferase gpi3 subunit isoform X1 [Panicum miliaceum]